MRDAALAPPAPPIDLLLALPDSKENTEILMGVVDAMRSGARWSVAEQRSSWYEVGDIHLVTPRAVALTLYKRGLQWRAKSTTALPNPLGTGEAADAAAYRMEERELLILKPPSAINPFWWIEWGHRHTDWSSHPDRKAAVCAAVCAKHAEHPEVGPLCRDVLRRLTGEGTR